MSSPPAALRPLLGLVCALVLLVGCQRQADLPTPVTPSVTAATMTSAPSASQLTVRQVFDGDTLQVRGPDGTLIKVRMLGIDAPEQGSCGFQEAADRLRELLPRGTSVALISDPKADAQDRFGRTLAYVEANGADVGAVMVTEGLVGVWWPSGEPKPVRAGDYQQLESTAKSTKTGSWRICARLGR